MATGLETTYFWTDAYTVTPGPAELTGESAIDRNTVHESNEPEALGDAGRGELMGRVRYRPPDGDPVH